MDSLHPPQKGRDFYPRLEILSGFISPLSFMNLKNPVRNYFVRLTRYSPEVYPA